jgi:hypothetical protein
MRWPWKRIVVAAAILGIVLVGAGWATKWLWPSASDRRPKLAEIPPLAPITLSSMIIAPAAITLTAIRDAMERAAPRELSGKPELPPPPHVSNAEIAWAISRGAFAVSGRPEGLTVSTAVSGSLRATGEMTHPGGGFAGPPGPPAGFSGPPGGFSGPPSGFRAPGGFPAPPPGFGPPPGFPAPPGDFAGPPGGLAGPGGFQGLPGAPPAGLGGSGRPTTQNQADRKLDDRAELTGNIVLTARPNLLAEWRLEPNLDAQVTIADASMTFMGTKLSLSNDVKPLLERTINEQVSLLHARMRNDPSLEQAVRRQWRSICRSISLGKVAPGMPDVWLELRPTRAFAAQPRIDQSSLTLTIGLQAETRIVPAETRPDCPFPTRLELVPQMEQGQINIALPVDVPFTEVSRLLEAQVKGKTFPEDDGSAFRATVRSLNLSASGDRLLVSLGLKIKETKSWFGFGAEAVIHVWARPVLDRGRQVIRLEDTAVDVESQAALGLFGAAAKAAVPALERALARSAVIDLQPLAANARRSLEAAIAEFHKNVSGVRVDAAITSVRLAGIDFDANTLRVMGEAAGTVRVAISALD